jgi:hypothetical protein
MQSLACTKLCGKVETERGLCICKFAQCAAKQHCEVIHCKLCLSSSSLQPVVVLPNSNIPHLHNGRSTEAEEPEAILSTKCFAMISDCLTWRGTFMGPPLTCSELILPAIAAPGLLSLLPLGASLYQAVLIGLPACSCAYNNAHTDAAVMSSICYY